MKPMYIYMYNIYETYIHIHTHTHTYERDTQRGTEREKKIWLNINNC